MSFLVSFLVLVLLQSSMILYIMIIVLLMWTPFFFVDVKYTRESAAYKYLHDQGQRCIPEYYGPYSTDINHSNNQSRTVRLILLEHVNGHSMATLRPTDYSVDFRKAVVKQIVSTQSLFYKINLRHRDTHLRNIMVQGIINPDPSEPHITFIDFGHAIIGRSPDPQNGDMEKRFLPRVYISPILRRFRTQGKEPVSNFDEWIDWDWNEWLLETYQSDWENIISEMVKLGPRQRMQTARKV